MCSAQQLHSRGSTGHDSSEHSSTCICVRLSSGNSTLLGCLTGGLPGPVHLVLLGHPQALRQLLPLVPVLAESLADSAK